MLEHICKQTCIIDKSTNIESDSSVITPSIIGKNCKIDKSAQIGPNASIGDNTIISSDVVIENSIIMSDCKIDGGLNIKDSICLLYTSPSPRDRTRSRMPSSA